MRAYVITDSKPADVHDTKSVVAVTSSRKTAIEGCEEFLGRTGETEVINWKRKDKHTGYAIKGNHVVTYQMFFVNRLED